MVRRFGGYDIVITFLIIRYIRNNILKYTFITSERKNFITSEPEIQVQVSPYSCHTFIFNLDLGKKKFYPSHNMA